MTLGAGKQKAFVYFFIFGGTGAVFMGFIRVLCDGFFYSHVFVLGGLIFFFFEMYSVIVSDSTFYLLHSFLSTYLIITNIYCLRSPLS